jgi:hypothetical protein
MGLTRAPESRPTPSAIYNIRIYLLAFTSCLGSWMFGYQNGVIPGVLVLPSFFRDFKLPPVGTQHYNNVTGNIVSLLQIGGLVGSMSMFPVMRWAGRRGGLCVSAGSYCVGAALQVRIYLFVMREGGLV